MIRVYGIFIFAFGTGIFASFFITKDVTKIFILVGCLVSSYGLFFGTKKG